MNEKQQTLMQTIIFRDIYEWEKQIMNVFQQKLSAFKIEAIKMYEQETKLLESQSSSGEIKQCNLGNQFIEITNELQRELLKLVPNYQTIKKIIESQSICVDCNASFINYDRLKKHITYRHKYFYPCGTCKQCFDTELSAWIHEEIIHAKLYPNNQCVYCLQYWADSKALRRHIVLKHIEESSAKFFERFGKLPAMLKPPESKINELKEQIKQKQQERDRRMEMRKTNNRKKYLQENFVKRKTKSELKKQKIETYKKINIEQEALKDQQRELSDQSKRLQLRSTNNSIRIGEIKLELNDIMDEQILNNNQIQFEDLFGLQEQVMVKIEQSKEKLSIHQNETQFLGEQDQINKLESIIDDNNSYSFMGKF